MRQRLTTCRHFPCGRKSSDPFGEYSYGPRKTSTFSEKFPSGGGVGVCHSNVVAFQGLFDSILAVLLRVWMTLARKGAWEIARSSVAANIIWFSAMLQCGKPMMPGCDR